MGAYNDDVLFIHIPKCGGTACKEYMAAHLPHVKWPRPKEWFRQQRGAKVVNGDDERQSRETIEASGLPIGHIPLRDIEKLTGRPPDSWERIIVPIRDPYVQQASQWLFWRERYAKGGRHPHDIHAAMHPTLDSWVKDPQSEFHLWYETTFAGALVPRTAQPYAAYGGMYAYWIGVNDAVPDNVVLIRQENLSHEFTTALAPFMDGPVPDLHESNVGVSTAHMDYYLSDEALQAVEARFAWTFANKIYATIRLVKP